MMNAIILAAGSGIRLGEYTQDIPKTLVDINGKSILERQISLLRKHKVNEIFVVTGYKKEKYVLKDVEYFFNPKYSETEQLTSMMTARRKIVGDVLIIFGDIIFDSDILQQVLSSNDDITIPIDLNWEKSYEEEPNKPADKVLIHQKKIVKISAKEITNFTSLDGTLRSSLLRMAAKALDSRRKRRMVDFEVSLIANYPVVYALPSIMESEYPLCTNPKDNVGYVTHKN